MEERIGLGSEVKIFGEVFTAWEKVPISASTLDSKVVVVRAGSFLSESSLRRTSCSSSCSRSEVSLLGF